MSQAMLAILSIGDVIIRTDEAGRFCLNDLHRAAGGEIRHRPADWLRNQKTIDLIREISIEQISLIDEKQPVAVKGGAPSAGGGTFICKDLVYAYAMWVSSAFHLKVIRSYDQVISVPRPALPDFTDAIVMARAWADQAERAIELAVKVEKQQVAIAEAKPKVEFYDQVSQATNSQTVADCAKVLGTGELRLFRWLRANGFLMSNNKPYQRYLDLGWFKVTEKPWTHPETGEVQIYAKTLITASGLQAIHRAMVPGDDLLASAKQKKPRKFGESVPQLLN